MVGLRLIWLLNDFDLLSVLLHAVTLSLEALLVGGVLFLAAVAWPAQANTAALRACRKGIMWTAGAMIAAVCCSVTVESAILVGNANVTVADALSSGPLIAATCAALFALTLLVLVRRAGRTSTLPGLAPLAMRALLLVCGLSVTAAEVSQSHAMSRLDHRALLVALTALHHLGTAAWIGAMPFLLATLRRTDDTDIARRVVARFSRMALAGAAMLISGGVGMAWLYIGTPSGLYGTGYGVLVMVKACLLTLILLLGASNWYIQREIVRAPGPLLLRLRRFAEVEIGLGFTAILAAAALTSQAPAIDMVQDRVTIPEIEARLHWEAPRLKSPPLGSLLPPTPLAEAVQHARFSGPAPSDANDSAWSEYNHHWAGLVVLLAGALALASRFRRFAWARFWPVSFAGLAAFLVLRADPENWPLGPRPFWGSFFAPDVVVHRAAALLILLFAAFECAVQAGRLRARWARYTFPLMCAVGAALLLTHNHGSGDAKEELLVEMNHSALALLGAVAGWARWLELRLPERGRERAVAGYIWPLALMLVAMVLLDYREM
jgi:putative copper resistance protein D